MRYYKARIIDATFYNIWIPIEISLGYTANMNVMDETGTNSAAQFNESECSQWE